jgi:hypothetical protein
MQPISELMEVDGIEIIGPLPAELQSPDLVYMAGSPAVSEQPLPAKALIDFSGTCSRTGLQAGNGRAMPDPERVWPPPSTVQAAMPGPCSAQRTQQLTLPPPGRLCSPLRKASIVKTEIRSEDPSLAVVRSNERDLSLVALAAVAADYPRRMQATGSRGTPLSHWRNSGRPPALYDHGTSDSRW